MEAQKFDFLNMVEAYEHDLKLILLAIETARLAIEQGLKNINRLKKEYEKEKP